MPGCPEVHEVVEVSTRGCAAPNKEAVQRALEFTITMQRQRLAFERISQREFAEDQINAPTIEYPA